MGNVESLWAAGNSKGVLTYDGGGYLDFRQINSVGNGGDGLTAAGERAASFTFIGNGTGNAFPMKGATFVDDWQPVACSDMVGSPTISDVIAASLGSGEFTDATCGASLTVDGFSEVGGSYALNIPTITNVDICLLYTSPSPRDATLSRMPSSA